MYQVGDVVTLNERAYGQAEKYIGQQVVITQFCTRLVLWVELVSNTSIGFAIEYFEIAGSEVLTTEDMEEITKSFRAILSL